MREDLRERAIKLIGKDNLNKLEQDGLTLTPKIRPPTYNRYPVGEKSIQGIVVWLEDNEPYPYVDQDPNGYELVISTYQDFDFTIWVGKQNTTQLLEME